MSATNAPTGGATYSVCGIPIAALTPAGAASLVVDRALRGGRFEVHLCNAYTLSLVDSDPLLRHALLGADLNLPDGSPVAWLGRRHGTDGPVRGPGLVSDVAAQGIPHGLRHYFFGAAEGVAQGMARRLEDRHPNLLTAGVESPAFGELTDADLAASADRIRESGAQLVWAGLGTPRQDHLVPRLAALVDLPVVPVGAAFDFWAGNVTEAPRWMHGTGLEWTYRLASEPQRLWRRYLIGNPRFVASALRHRARR